MNVSIPIYYKVRGGLVVNLTSTPYSSSSYTAIYQSSMQTTKRTVVLPKTSNNKHIILSNKSR